MIINDDHFKYLYIQRGEVSDAYRRGFAEWQAAYEASLNTIMAEISPHLPRVCSNVLDVGGGLGGMGVLLSRRFPRAAYHVVDGVADQPVVRKHAETFNDASVSADFLARNGVRRYHFYNPSVVKFPYNFDVVISFAAWGFHIAPSVYIDRVKDALAPQARIILDVRRDKREWIEELGAAFGMPTILHRGKKHVRLAWKT